MSFILQLAGGALQSSLSLRPSIRSFSVKVDVPDKRRHKNAAKTLAKAFAKSYGEKVGREVDPANLSLECNGTKLPSDATCGELLDSRRIMICVRERMLRRGCMVFHARSSGELVDLPFYCHLKSFRPIPPETERVILDEVELAMDYNDVAPELRDATRLVSVAPTFEKYLDRCGAGPFWLIRHDPPAAQQAVAESDLF